MTPAARLQAAIEIADAIDAAVQAAAGVMDSTFRRRRYMGSKDRRAVGERVFGLLRRRARLGWWGAETNRRRVLADIVLSDGLDRDAVSALFDGTGHGPTPLEADEAAWLEGLYGHPLDHPDMSECVRHEVPEWLEDGLREAFGARFADEAEALNHPAALDLRVNRSRGTREAAIVALAADGVGAVPTPLAPAGLRCAEKSRLGNVRAFRHGLVEVQDEGSQVAAAAVGARPGMVVIDYCAGGGGKTLAMADAMILDGKVEGELWACDIDARRLAGLDERLRRSRLGPVRTHVLDRPLGVEADRVLVDAPCTGSGTWRRRPEAKWRLTPDDLAARLAEQARILDAAAQRVRPGGHLVYVTCSVLRAENEAQVARFLTERSDFAPLGEARRLSPAADGTDGFFVAAMRRAD